ncbi:uncharacterized protein B0T23DRAFT_350810 [Neurospora hispaniola]|uniref:Uncharacterized protein n=1 Tax=Neurospora hispaniola TaxID=588809 RepID=A0AAJ0IGR4_9PEZI|nr:hypothetical protein B0T23DRAFT_350810 [Neurospora hispaniola]
MDVLDFFLLPMFVLSFTPDHRDWTQGHPLPSNNAHTRLHTVLPAIGALLFLVLLVQN